MADETPRLRGFAALKAKNPERLREIAALGGAAVSPDQRSFSKDRKLAAAAGSTGGTRSHGGDRR